MISQSGFSIISVRKFLQWLNASKSIFLTPFDIVTDVRLSHPLNAPFSIIFIVLDKLKDYSDTASSETNIEFQNEVSLLVSENNSVSVIKYFIESFKVALSGVDYESTILKSSGKKLNPTLAKNIYAIVTKLKV